MSTSVGMHHFYMLEVRSCYAVGALKCLNKLELELELIASITEEQYKTSKTDYKSAKHKKSIGCK